MCCLMMFKLTLQLIWICIFLGSATLSKAGKFDFGETDPRNRPAKQTPEANFPSRTPHFETHPIIWTLGILFAHVFQNVLSSTAAWIASTQDLGTGDSTGAGDDFFHLHAIPNLGWKKTCGVFHHGSWRNAEQVYESAWILVAGFYSLKVIL